MRRFETAVERQAQGRGQAQERQPLPVLWAESVDANVKSFDVSGERKKAKTNAMVALKAVSHKLARACYRACYYVMRDGVPFDAARCFG